VPIAEEQRYAAAVMKGAAGTRSESGAHESARTIVHLNALASSPTRHWNCCLIGQRSHYPGEIAMTHRMTARFHAVATLALLAACGDSPGGPSDDLSDEELLTLALTPSAGSGSSGTAPCPAGGNVIGTGSSNSSTNGEITTLTFDLSVDYVSCAQAIGQRTITLDGDVSRTGLIRFRVPASGPTELLEAGWELTGTLRDRGDGFDLTCALDVTTSYQPSAGRYNVVGEVCGRNVSQTITL
jgi:hypothetical protein